jgi:hypothetical protein
MSNKERIKRLREQLILGSTDDFYEHKLVVWLMEQYDTAQVRVKELARRDDWVCPTCRKVYRYEDVPDRCSSGLPICCTVMTPLWGWELTEAERKNLELQSEVDRFHRTQKYLKSLRSRHGRTMVKITTILQMMEGPILDGDDSAEKRGPQ